MFIRALPALVLLCACVTADPFDDVMRAQQRLDERGVGFGVTRVPGHDAFVFQLRFSTSDTSGDLNTDPMAAAQAAAPEGCTVASVTPQPDGTAYRVDYRC
jgi:hypothetical protein